jgi:hypothetical protein
MTAMSEDKLMVPQAPPDPGAARWVASVISVIFHPVFIPVYITVYVLYGHQLLFAGYTNQMKERLVATVFVNLTMLPAITVLLCWRLKFIKSLRLGDQKDRIIPLAAAMIFYFWCWFVLKNFSEIPLVFRNFLLGAFIAVIGGWLANIVFKVSLHALAAGGMFSFMLILLFSAEGGSASHFAVATLLAGTVCTSRLMLSAHRPFDMYAGFIIGAISQAAPLVV